MSFKIFFQVAIILMCILPWIMGHNCHPEQYRVEDRNGTFLNCRDCLDCPDMYGATSPCNTVIYRDTMIDCVRCDLGKTFSSGNNNQQCQPCKSTTCHRNEEWTGVCTDEEDNTRCTGTCVTGYYWNKNLTEPCQPCKSTTCHQNEEVVGMCSPKEDNTRCNGTCFKGYYWSKNPTEPCQPCKNITCHRNELVVGMCTPKEDNTRCNGTCFKGYYWSKNPTEPCQPCKNITCHRNEVVVGMCTPKEDNTQCNGTCVKGYYWSKNRTEPCQPLYHLSTMTNGGQLCNDSYLVIKIVIPIACIIICIGVVLLCWCIIKKRLRSKYARCQRTDDFELANRRSTDATDVSPNDDSPNADNIETENIVLPLQGNNNGIQENKLSSKYADARVPPNDVGADEPSLHNVELVSRNEALSSLSTPGGTPTLNHKPSSSRELEITLSPSTPGGTSTSKHRESPSTKPECKVETYKIDDMDPETFRTLHRLFDRELVGGHDCITLASHLSFFKKEMDMFKNEKNPTEVMLNIWVKKSSKNTVLALARIVREKMERFDVSEILEKVLNSQHEQCNCDNCPQIPSYAEEPAAL